MSNFHPVQTRKKHGRPVNRKCLKRGPLHWCSSRDLETGACPLGLIP